MQSPTSVVLNSWNSEVEIDFSCLCSTGEQNRAGIIGFDYCFHETTEQEQRTRTKTHFWMSIDYPLCKVLPTASLLCTLPTVQLPSHAQTYLLCWVCRIHKGMHSCLRGPVARALEVENPRRSGCAVIEYASSVSIAFIFKSLLHFSWFSGETRGSAGEF